MQFYISLLEEQNFVFLKIVEVIRRDPPVVEGERRSIFYSPRALPRVHGVLTRPGWFSHRDQRTWITQGLFAKGKDQDLAVQLVYLLKHNRFPVSRKWKIGWGELSLQVSTSLEAVPEIIRKRLEKLTTSGMTPYKGNSERDEV